MHYKILSLRVLAKPYSSSMHNKPNQIINKKPWVLLEMIEQQYYKQISTNGAQEVLTVLKSVKSCTVPSSVIGI